MTDVEKLLALITIQAAAMTNRQRAECNAAWLKLMDAEKPFQALATQTLEAGLGPYKAPVFIGWGDDDGDD